MAELSESLDAANTLLEQLKRMGFSSTGSKSKFTVWQENIGVGVYPTRRSRFPEVYLFHKSDASTNSNPRVSKASLSHVAFALTLVETNRVVELETTEGYPLSLISKVLASSEQDLHQAIDWHKNSWPYTRESLA